jgi:hypothetical protein
MTTDRLYTIQPAGYFDVGVCSDGRKVLMGLLCPYLVAYFFDAHGNLNGGQRKIWETPAPRMSENGPYQLYGEEFCSALDRQKQQWQNEIQFHSAPIHIKEFFDAEHFAGIELLPEHYQDLESDTDIDEEERQELIVERDDWLECGNFVLWWGNDYYMSEDGKVESS